MNRTILLAAALLASMPASGALAATPDCTAAWPTDDASTLHAYAPDPGLALPASILPAAALLPVERTGGGPACGDGATLHALPVPALAAPEMDQTSAAAPEEPPEDAALLSAAAAPPRLAEGIGGILGLVLACACVLAYALGRRVSRSRPDPRRDDVTPHAGPAGASTGPRAPGAPAAAPRPAEGACAGATASRRPAPARPPSHAHGHVLGLVDSGPDGPGLLTRRPPEGMPHGAPP